MNKEMSMEYWWNISDRQKLAYLDKTCAIATQLEIQCGLAQDWTRTSEVTG
jgi:hypothetical protein